MAIRPPIQWYTISRALRTRRIPIEWSQCRVQAQSPSRSAVSTGIRTQVKPFSSSSVCLKKAGKAKGGQVRESIDNGGAPGACVDDAFDFSELESKIMKAMEQLTHDLSQLRSGGRFNPNRLEELKVELGKDGEKRIERLKNLAQVIVKGRNVQIQVHDEEHVKPVNTSIATSTLNLTPHGPTKDAPATLTIQVPPPTGESRMEAVASANQAAEAALVKIKDARGKHHKKLRAMGVDKKVRPDDLQKAQKQMEDVVKRRNEEVKRIQDDVKKVLERG